MAKPVRGTPSWLRETNERTALSLLFEHGVLTRNQLGELSGLSKPTASQIVSRLEQTGIIEAVGEVSGGRGPNAASYGVRTDRVLGVAVEIDDAVIRSTAVDATGAEHPVAEAEIDRAGRDAAADLRGTIDSACASAGFDATAVRTVTIGLQGSIDPRTDELSFIDTLPGWPRKAVSATLADALGRDVQIDNDVNLAAIAERCEGAAHGASSFALLWMGEGLGLAVDLAGTVHHGAAGGAGEIGYLPVPRVAEPIDADATNLQDLLGGPALVRLAAQHGVHARSLADLCAILATHPAREAVLSALAPRIALGIVPVLAILDPETIVLGGPLGSAGGAELAALVSGEIQTATLWNPMVAASEVAQFPVLRGARELLLRDVRKRLLGELGEEESEKRRATT